MKLSAKLLLLFGLGLVLMLGLAAWGFPRLVSRVSETQLRALALTVGGYLVHDLSTLPFTGDEAAFEKSIDARFEFVQALGTETANFRAHTLILVDRKLRVEVAHPESERGADYSSHADIREAFGKPGISVVLERSTAAGAAGTVATSQGVVDADIVAALELADGDSRVLEVKLDFTGTLALLESQYSRVLLVASLFIAGALLVLVTVLLLGVRRAVLRPLLGISEAMERVGSGDLGASAEARGRDEIAAMGQRFNDMVRGLKEGLELGRYVSRSTMDVAKARAVSGPEGHNPVERKSLAILFTDVRGFTSYSERTDPARVIATLNRLLGVQEEIVDACSGYVDKFVGDETMAVFERPVDAAAAALAIRERTTRLGQEIDGLELGLGLHWGELVEGDIGSPRMMNHTVIGDTVNVAARLQAAAGPGRILLSAAMARDPGVAATFELTPLGGLRVKGKELPVEAWELGKRKSERGPAIAPEAAGARLLP